MTEYIEAKTPQLFEESKKLFMEYAASLGCSPCLQNIEKELGDLPREYGPPDGRLLLAVHDGAYAGCVAFRKIGEGMCEMRRMFLRPGFRGKKIGKGLAMALLQEARKEGYVRMRLYTLPSMREAVSLYDSLGFTDIPPYGEHIIPDALYRELYL